MDPDTGDPHRNATGQSAASLQVLPCGSLPMLGPLEGRARSRSVGERQWTRVRAVMAWYTRLRRIKRTKSSQRWMKLRTTVQLTNAISNSVQSKKASLKREDSFLKRFSTRQLPETQETFDCTDEGGSSSGGGNGNSQEISSSTRRLRRLRRVKPPRSVLNPDENGLFYWLGFLSLWVLYNYWTIIIRLAFPELHDSSGYMAWNVCDALGDFAYVVDIVVQFRTGYLEQGIMVHDSKKLALHYLRSRAFLVDLASLVPFDWFLLAQFQMENQPLARWRPALRLFRMVKIYRVCSFYYVVESRTVYPNAWRVINLVHILLLLAHWFGCFYFLISEAEGFRSDWSYPYPEGDFASMTRKYLGSLYWSTLTLTTIGDLPTPESNTDKRPRRPLLRTSRQVSASLLAGLLDVDGVSLNATSSPDSAIRALPRRGFKSRLLHHVTNQGYVFTIASYLIGVFIFATIVGQVGNVITNRNASRLEFERLLDSAKLYMRHHKVPRSMQRRVQRWYDYSWSRGRIQGNGDANSALRILPDKLKTELALHVNLSTLKKVSIFKECQPEFLHDLVLKMRSSIFTPGDMVCRRGEVAREMFIIADGILEVISETGKVLTTMQAGDFFGEIGILNLDGLNKRTADVRSVGYSELFSLSREHVLSAMKDYPEAEDILLNLGRKRLLEARKAASQHRAQMARKAFLALDSRNQFLQKNPAEDGNAASKLTDKLRNDVRGIRDALRKSFKDTRRRARSSSPEHMEMGLLSTSSLNNVSQSGRKPSGASSMTSSGSRGVLRRMARVSSYEVASSDDNQSVTQPLLHQQEPPHEVIGAGLPLMQRLKLLRQKEQEQEREQQQQQLKVSSSHLLMPAAANCTKEEKQLKHISFVEESVTKTKKENMESIPKTRWTLAVVPRTTSPRSPNSSQLKPPLDVIPSCSSMESNENFCQDSKDKPLSPNIGAKSLLSLSPRKSMPILRNRLYKKQHTISSDGDIHPSRPRPRPRSGSTTVSQPNPSKRCLRQQTIQIVSDVESVLTDIIQDILPSRPALQIPEKDPTHKSVSSGNLSSEAKEEDAKRSVPLQVRSVDRPRKLRLLKRGSKNYASIDDLSPEYTVLPFVKRLKILNERQKIAELERQLTVVRHPSSENLSSSEGVILEVPTLPPRPTVNEGTATEKLATNEPKPAEVARSPVSCNTSPLNSPESNETPERRSLKKILKQLSKTCSDNIIDQHHKSKLMRSQTVEGYAARHSSFATLCRRDKKQYGFAQTMPSPLKEDATQTSENRDNDRNEPPEILASPEKPPANVPEPVSRPTSLLGEQTRGKLMKAFGGEMTKEEEYVSELLMGIKQVLQERLKDIQLRFQARIDRLEQELERKDMVISQLHLQLDRNQSAQRGNSELASGLVTEDEGTSQDEEENLTTGEESGEEENEEHVATYFARSTSRGSVIKLSPPVNSPPRDVPVEPIVENLLDREMESESRSLPEALNPQQLWQLEFGSCWDRIEEHQRITANPRDLILDLESDSEQTSQDDFANISDYGATGETCEPYVPDWEIQMLAEVMEHEETVLSPPVTVEEPERNTVRCRKLKTFSSLSEDQQRSFGTKSKRRLEKWFQSYPPPRSASIDYPARPSSSKLADIPVIEEEEPLL